MSDAQNWYELFVNGVRDYAFMLFDTSNKVTHWNVGAERILGWTESEISGQPGAVFFTPEDRAAGEVEKELETALREGRAEDERWHLRKDGSRFWASGIITALRGDNGEHIGFAKVLRDLTQRRNAAEALQESEKRLRLFQQNVREYALILLDMGGNISMWNTGAQLLFDYTDAEIVGIPFAQLFTPDDREAGYPGDVLERASRKHRMEDERWFVRKGGSRFWGYWVLHTVEDEDGRMRGYGVVVHDETDRKLEADRRTTDADKRVHENVRQSVTALDRTKLELRDLAAQLLEAQEEERRRLARELHDDLAQELAALQIELEMLLSKPGNLPESARGSLENATMRCRSLSDRVRDLSHSLHPSILADLGLEDALRNLVEGFVRLHNVEIVVFIEDLPSDLPVDIATVVYRVTQEALRNAVKHAPGSRVSIVVSHSSGVLYLEISDNGPGFDKTVLGPGRGLGLISMQERIHLAGGTLQVRAMPDAGTTLVAMVPCDPARGKAVAPPPRDLDRS